MMIPIFAVILFVVFVMIVANVRIVPQSRACVIERLGAYCTTWQVGFHVKLPFIDRIANRCRSKKR